MPRADFWPSIFGCSFFDEKADFSFLGLRRGHELADRLEDHLELRVVSLFQRFKFSSEVLMGRQYFSQPHKGAHDFDIDLDRTLATKNARKHGDALFGEHIGQVSATPSSFGF